MSTYADLLTYIHTYRCCYEEQAEADEKSKELRGPNGVAQRKDDAGVHGFCWQFSGVA